MPSIKVSAGQPPASARASTAAWLRWSKAENERMLQEATQRIRETFEALAIENGVPVNEDAIAEAQAALHAALAEQMTQSYDVH